ncbi:MAG: carboxypeptidase-like regulatory domain-containing protein [Planctomycetota bacterium]
MRAHPATTLLDGPAPRAGRTSGRSSAALLVAIAVVLVILGLLLVRATTGPGSGVRAGDDATAVTRIDTTGPVALEGDGLAKVIGDLATVRGTVGAACTAVRLSGPGRLVGMVRERAADGTGVADCTVQLLPIPAVGAHVAVHATKLFGLGSEFTTRVRPVASTTTDGLGGFEFRGVREGTWYLDVVAPHHVADAPVQARVMASGSGGPVDVWVRPAGRVVGRVVGPDGARVPDADVALTTGAMRFLEAMADGDVAMLRARTDGEGRFEFSGVAPAEGYELAAIGEGMTITHVLDIAVHAGEDTEVLVQGRPGATVTGRIVSRGLGDDADLEPLAGARVGALPRGIRHLKLAREILVSTHAVTGADGGYSIRGLPSGAFDVVAIADGHVPGRGPVARVGGGGVAVVPEFALERGPMVRGRVVDSAGRPVQGARVLWNLIDARKIEGQPSLAPLFIAGMREFSFPETGPDGAFVAGPFSDSAPHVLRVACVGYETAKATWRPSSKGAAVDGVAEPERLDEIVVTLSSGGRIEGRVRDLVTGEPVTTFSVRVTDRIEVDPAAPTRLNPFAGGVEVEDPEGRFVVEAVEAGDQTLSIHADDYLDADVSVTVVEGAATRDVVVSLRRGATVRGVVVDSAGEPVAGAQVTTERLVKRSFDFMEDERKSIEDDLAVRGRRRQNRPPPVGFLRYAAALGLMGTSVVTSEPDGSFELTGVEPGRQEILAFHRDFRSATVPVDLKEGDENPPVSVVMTQGGGLKGRVRDRFGRPVVDATVIAASPGLANASASSGDLHQARTNADGAYEMLHMEGGPYFLIATRGDEDLAPTSFLGTLNFGLVSVPDDRVVTHDLVDTSAAACRVHGLVLRDGAPVDGGTLLALNLDAEGLLGVDFKAAPIENDGRYEFEGLAPGEYQLTFEGRGRSVRGAMILDVPDASELRYDVVLPDGSIRGRIVDRSTGEPIPRARVTLTPLDRLEGPGLLAQMLAGEVGVERERTDGEGRFRFDRLAEGSYRIGVEQARRQVGDSIVEYAPMRSLTVDLGEDEDADVGDLELDPGVRVEGVVRDETGAPIVGADVVASPKPLRRVRPRRATSNDEGRFVLNGLGPGKWQITASSDEHAEGEPFELEVDEGVETVAEEVELRLVSGVLVRALVTDAAGEPVAGAACVLRREGRLDAGAISGSGNFLERFFRGGAATDGTGTMDLGRHAEGRYELRVTQGLRSASRAVELPISGTRTLRITLP